MNLNDVIKSGAAGGWVIVIMKSRRDFDFLLNYYEIKVHDSFFFFFFFFSF